MGKDMVAKDDLMGTAEILITDAAQMKEGLWIPLQGCKSGELFVSVEIFQPKTGEEDSLKSEGTEIQEKEARLKAEAEALKAKQEEEARLKAEAEAAKAKQEEEAKQKAEKAKQEEEARLKAEAEADKAKQEEEAKQKAEAEKAKQEEEARLKAEAEAAKAKQE